MEIEILHTQSVWRPSSRELKTLLQWLLLRHPAPRTIDTLCIITTDHVGISLQNQRILKHEGMTDVISCLYDPLVGSEGCHGDIIVNVELAAEWSARDARFPRGWDATCELVLYLFHGWDHLCGATDDSVAGRRAMRRRELGWIRRAGEDGLLDGLECGRQAKRPVRRC